MERTNECRAAGTVALAAAALGVALVATLTVGCGDPSDDTPLDIRGRDLIADPTTPFEVLFEWRDPYKQDAYLLWRQADGVRRWDLISVAGGNPLGGDISIEVPEGEQDLHCLWTASTPNEAALSCSSGSYTPIFTPLEDMFFLRVERQLSSRVIAGRPAACYGLRHPELVIFVLCVDKNDGVPLYILSRSLSDQRFSQSMSAIDIETSAAQEPLLLPIQLEETDPILGPRAEVTLPTEELGLPDLP